jgi:N-acetylglucosaminyldiphosphoundecaprenol N-acetyl-beta-D-mannosaminyltransferase
MFRETASRFTGNVWTNEHITPGGAVSEYAEEALLVPRVTEKVTRVSRPALPIALLGVPFDNVTIPQALEQIEAMIASQQPHYVVTANVDFCIQALEDVELRRILFDANLVLCDGTPLVWASRLFGNPLPERVAGADLVPLLLERAAKKGYRVFFLGGSAQVAQQAVERLHAQYPDLVIAGHYSPPFRALLDMNHDEICERVRAAQPDLLLVSFGCPKAEKWIAMHYHSLGVPVCMGVGATIDFLAGRVRRAPGWMQRIGTEWVYRLAQEPRRLWGRYAKDLRRLGGPLMTQLWTQRLSRYRNGHDRRTAITVFERTWVRMQMPKCFDRHTLLADGELWEQSGGQHCLLDLSEVEFIDSTALAALVQLHRRIQPCKLVLLAPSPPVARILRRFQLESFFCIAADTIEARAIISPPAPAAPESAAFSNPVPPLFWTGELTAVNAENVWSSTQKQLETLCSAGQANAAIDLAELRFIDSTGVGIMLRAKRYAQNLGARLRFLNAQPNVRNVLHLARLDVFLLQQ